MKSGRNLGTTLHCMMAALKQPPIQHTGMLDCPFKPMESGSNYGPN